MPNVALSAKRWNEADMRDMLNHPSSSQPEAYYDELERSELSQKAVGIYAKPSKT